MLKIIQVHLNFFSVFFTFGEKGKNDPQGVSFEKD